MAVLPKALHRLRILVIGGSIAGLACGYALAKAGHDVVIFERSDGLWRSPALAHCPPQMIRTLIRWGVDYAKLIQLGTVLDAAGYKLAPTDTPLYTLYFRGVVMDDLRAPWLLLPHGELHTLLYDLAVGAGVEFRFHAEVVHVDPQRPSIHLASGEAWIGDLVVGADGHNGIVRKVVAGEEPPVPPPRMASLNMQVPAEKMRNDPELAQILEEQWTAWIGDDIALQGVYSPSTQTYNLKFECPIQDGWNLTGQWDVSIPLAQLDVDLSGFHPRIQRLIALAEVATPVPFLTHSQLDDWVHEDDKVVLMGDAAMPYPAPGMFGSAMAVEDADVLGTLFRKLRRAGQARALLGAYEELRPAWVATVAERDSLLRQAWRTLPDDATISRAAAAGGEVIIKPWEDFFAEGGYIAFEVALYEAHEAAEGWLAQWPGHAEDDEVEPPDGGVVLHTEVESHILA